MMDVPSTRGALRLAVVGGGFAEQHLNWIAARPELSATLLCYGSNRAKAEALAGRFGVAGVSDDPLAAVRSGEIDGLVVVSPPACREELVSAALAGGVPVLSDKPLAASLATARRLAEAASQGSAAALVLFQWRLHPLFLELRRRAAAGALGRPLHVALSFRHDFLAGVETHWRWRHLWDEAGAGALGDMGVHLFDLLRFLVPGEWEVASARGAQAHKVRRLDGAELACETEDLADVLLREPGSATRALVSVSRASPGMRRISGVLAGSEGSAEFAINPEDAGGVLTIWRSDAEPEVLRFDGAAFNPYADFARACAAPATGTAGFATFDDGLRAQELLEQARQEMLSGGEF